MFLSSPVPQRSVRRGAVAPVVAVCLTVLVAFVAIATDGGVLLSERRHAQAVADSAALAAAADLYANYSSNQGNDPGHHARDSARTIAAANGYPYNGSNSTVTVNIPPTSGRFSGKKGYAEVIVQFNQSRGFSGIFASGSLPVAARCVARGLQVPISNAGIIVLNPTKQDSFKVTGPGAVTVKSGAIIVDSNHSQAASITGDGNVFATEVDITGENPGYKTSGHGVYITSPISNNVKVGQPSTPDPLSKLPEPDPTQLPLRSSSTLQVNTVTTLQPGKYVGGIKISGGVVTMLPGIYYMDHGGFSQSNGTVTGVGVMIFNAPNPGSGQKVTITGGNFVLSAPTEGTYQGIMIFQARNAGQVPVEITGPGTSKMIGTVYAASSPVAVTGAGGATIGSQFISDTLTVTGAGPFFVDWAGAPQPPAREIRIAE